MPCWPSRRGARLRTAIPSRGVTCWRQHFPLGHSRVVQSYDTALGTILGVLLLVLALGGVVWLDMGPVGRRGRALRHGKQAPWPHTWRGWLTGKDSHQRD